MGEQGEDSMSERMTMRGIPFAAMKEKLLRKLRGGIKVPFVNLVATIDLRRLPQDEARENDPAFKHAIALRTLRRLIAVFPELHAFYHPSVETDFAGCLALLDFYHQYIPLFHEPARETQVRNLLFGLDKAVRDDGFKKVIAEEIAKSNLRSGVPERATVLLDDRAGLSRDPAFVAQLRADIEAYEHHYGSRAGLIRSLDLWKSFSGDTRGRSLRFFLSKTGIW